MTTAGNLVFAASNWGDFEAFSADKGEKLWSVKLVPGFANPVSYMLDGKQYVSRSRGTQQGPPLYVRARRKRSRASAAFRARYWCGSASWRSSIGITDARFWKMSLLVVTGLGGHVGRGMCIRG